MKKNLNEIMENAKEIKASARGGGNNSKLSLSIVNSNNGKRIMFSKGLLEELNNPTKIEFMISSEDGALIVGENLRATNSYNFSKGNEKIVYCGGIINSLTDIFNLDYKGRTSLSFSEIEIDSYMDSPVAIIAMKSRG